MYTETQIKKNIWMYYLVQFFTGALFTIPVWVAYERSFLNYSQMSFLESSVFLVGMLFELPSSALADLLGRKKTVLLGWAISGCAYIVIGLTNNLAGLITGLLFIGVGGAFVSGADTALIYDFLKSVNRENYFPRLNALGVLFYRLSMIFAIYIGGYLGSIQLSYGYLFRGIFQLVALIPILVMIEVPFVKERLSLRTYLIQLRRGFLAISNSNYLKDIVIYYSFIAAVTWACLYYFNNTFANDVGFTAQGQSKIFTFVYIVTTSLLLYFVNFTKISEKPKLIFFGFPILLIISLLPGVIATKNLAIPMLIGVILAGGARFSILDGFLNKLIESRDRATILSSISILVNMLFVTLMLIGGKIQEIYSTKTVFTLMGVLILLTGLPYTFKIVRRYHS